MLARGADLFLDERVVIDEPLRRQGNPRAGLHGFMTSACALRSASSLSVSRWSRTSDGGCREAGFCASHQRLGMTYQLANAEQLRMEQLVRCWHWQCLGDENDLFSGSSSKGVQMA